MSFVVIMGIGELFDNYDEMMCFLKIINSDDGLNIGVCYIIVLISGIILKIYKFVDEKM